MQKSWHAAIGLPLVVMTLAVGCGSDFEERAEAVCEESYQRLVGGPEFPDRSERGHRAFVRGCVEGEKQRRAELGPEYEPR